MSYLFTPDRELNDDFENVPHVEDSAKSAMVYAEAFAEWLCKFGGVDATAFIDGLFAFIEINDQFIKINESGDLVNESGAVESLYYIYQNYGDRLK